MGSVVRIMILPKCRAQNNHDIQDHPTSNSSKNNFKKVKICIENYFLTHILVSSSRMIDKKILKAQNNSEMDNIYIDE